MKERTTVMIPKELHRQAKIRAATKGIDLYTLIEDAVRAYLEEDKE